MSMRLDLSRPDVIYAGGWLAAIALIGIMPIGFVVPPHPAVQVLVVSNIVTFYLIYRLIAWIQRSKRVPGPLLPEFVRSPAEQRMLSSFVQRLFWIWLPLYLLTIVASGGLPVVWLVAGSGKTYTDFGVPTLSGLLNMIRAFAFSGGVLLYLVTGRIRHLMLPFLMFAFCVAEVSRGGMLVLLLHGVGIYLLYKRVSVRTLFNVMLLAFVFILAFGAMGDFRGNSLKAENFVEEDSAFVTLPLGFFFAVTYIVTPLNNLYYSAETLVPLHYPYYTLQPLFPTVIRDLIFSTDPSLATKYPIDLYIDSFNATSFYGPLLADFGFIGAWICVIFLQIATCYVHVMARRGSLVHFLMYPALFMSVLLSTFYMYFFAMVVVLYPVLALMYAGFRRSRLMRVHGGMFHATR